MNGFLSFTNNYNSFTSAPFPLNDGVSRDIVAVFWADADSSGVLKDDAPNGKAFDVVYYHVYNDNINQSRQIYDRATRDGRKYLSSKFTADWVMVVTWHQVTPFPRSLYSFSSEVS